MAKGGDRNTKSFLKFDSQRRETNTISSITDENGNKITSS